MKAREKKHDIPETYKPYHIIELEEFGKSMAD